MDNYQSKQQSGGVGDQSGLFAGNGGYDIFAGHHTQFNGAVELIPQINDMIFSSAKSHEHRKINRGQIGTVHGAHDNAEC